MPDRKIYKITIESGLEDGWSVNSRTFYIDEADDEMLWLLLNRIGVTREMWEKQQRKRAAEERAKKHRAEEARRMQEEYLRGREEREKQADEERARRARDEQAKHQFFTYANTAGFTSATRDSEEAFHRLFDAFNGGPSYFGRPDGTFSTPRAEHKTSTPKHKSNKEKLADMAEIAWSVAQTMDNKALLKKAQRKCHPDTGGSHQKWLDLQSLQRSMGI